LEHVCAHDVKSHRKQQSLYPETSMRQHECPRWRRFCVNFSLHVCLMHTSSLCVSKKAISTQF